MKKNISTTHSLLLLPLLTCPSLLSMDKKQDFNPMMQSLYIPTPTKQSSSLVRGVRNTLWSTETNVQHALNTKQFNPDDMGDAQDLQIAVQNLITNKQPKELCALLAAGRKNYAGDIKIGDDQAIAAHNFLANHGKQHMESVQQKVEAENKLPLDGVTKNIDELTKAVTAHLVIIRSQLTPNVENGKTIIAENGDHIRTLQTGLVNLRYISNLKNKRHQLDGSVEQDENAVEQNYSNDNIAKKVETSSLEKRIETRNVNKLSMLLQDIEENLALLNAHMQVMTEKK